MNRQAVSQFPGANYASGDGVLSVAERVDDAPRPPSDTLYVVADADVDIRETFPSRPMRDLASEETGRGADISNAVVDFDIRAAKWAWALLVMGHCWLIYFMVQNLG